MFSLLKINEFINALYKNNNVLIQIKENNCKKINKRYYE